MNSKQAKLLKYAVEHPQETYTQITAYAGVSEASSNRHCLDELRKMNYVHFWNNPASLPIEVTGLGLEALEEYEAKQQAETRENNKLKALQNQVDELKAQNQIFQSALSAVQDELNRQKKNSKRAGIGSAISGGIALLSVAIDAIPYLSHLF